MALLGRIISAAAGRAAARQLGGVSAGPLGALAGVALPFMLRRFGPLGMIGMALGGYAVKKIADAEGQRQARDATAPLQSPAPQGRDTSISSLPKLPPV